MPAIADWASLGGSVPVAGADVKRTAELTQLVPVDIAGRQIRSGRLEHETEDLLDIAEGDQAIR